MDMFKDLPKPFFILAPMDDVTDTVFRQIIADCAAPDLFFTEFVNVDGLQSVGRAKLLPKLKFTENDRPLIAQLWGKNPENFYKTAMQIADGSLAKELGLPEGVNFAGVDLNMGCPAKSEVQNGTCSALILPMNRGFAGQIIDASMKGLKDGREAIKNSTPLPLSVKTRLGFHEIDYSWHEFLLGKKLNMLTIHARTKKQMSKVPAEWDKVEVIRELRDKHSPATFIVGNGDVLSRQQGHELAKKHGLDGVMVGRGVFQDPYVFAANTPWESIAKPQRIELYRKHVQLFADTWMNNERRLITLNKFCKIYINGFDGAKEMREKLMVAESAPQLLDMLS
jgi:tRNA-dihydrouridine synthase